MGLPFYDSSRLGIIVSIHCNKEEQLDEVTQVELEFDTIWDDDLGGYWCPPTYSNWTPTIVSLIFSVSLIIAQFTIFGSFQVLNFWSRFEALNDVFLASNG